MQQIAPPQEVYVQPANLHVARFMGYRNVLELDVAREEGERVTLAGPDIALAGTRKLPLAGRRALRRDSPGGGRRSATTPAPPTRSPAGSTTSSTAAAIRWSTCVTPAGALLHVRRRGTPRVGDTVARARARSSARSSIRCD